MRGIKRSLCKDCARLLSNTAWIKPGTLLLFSEKWGIRYKALYDTHEICCLGTDSYSIIVPLCDIICHLSSDWR